jgi:tetratricopeptide (TPR) repeat protein
VISGEQDRDEDIPALKRSAAAGIVVAAAVAITLWPTGEPPATPVRLAVLPAQVAGSPLPGAAGLMLDVADRLSGIRRGFVVIPPDEAALHQADSAESAKAALGATHLLRTRMVVSGAFVGVNASVIDAGSGQTLPPELRGSYSLDEVPLLAKALASTVTGAFHLTAGAPPEPVTPAAYPAYLEGISLLRRDQYSADHAIPYFQRAIGLNPRSALPYAGLAEAQLQKASQGFGREWLDLAGESVARAMNLNPDAPLVLLAAGLYHHQKGQYEMAARNFKRAADLAPDNADAWSRLASVYAAAGRTADAVLTYEKAIQAQPKYYLNYLRFGNFYYERGQFEAAERMYRKVIECAPALSSGHMNLGLVLNDMGRVAEAEKSLRRALRHQENPRTLGNLAVLYYRQERYREAAELFEKSVRLQPSNAVFYEDLGDAYSKLRRARDAAEAYRKAREISEEEFARNPRDVYARARLAYLASAMGDRARALAEIAQALALAPDDTRVARYAAFTFETLRLRDRTLEAIARAPARLLAELNRAPDLRALQQDARFQELLQRANP